MVMHILVCYRQQNMVRNAGKVQFMTEKPPPVAISQEQVDKAFQEGNASNVTIIRLSDKEWIFTFEATNPINGLIQIYTLKTQRGKVRTWSDPRNLFQWLCERHGINKGSFSLVHEEWFDEK
jgi:hypothetical protein